jgi:hypothetical protein
MRLFKKEQQIGFDCGAAFRQQRMSVEEQWRTLAREEGDHESQ